MPSPSSALSTQRPDLAASFEEFDLASDRAGFIASSVMPVIEVAKQAGNFGKIPIEQLLQTRDTLRAPGSGYSRGSFTFEPVTYTCEEHGAEEPIDDSESLMYREYFDAEQLASLRAYDAVLRNAEIRAAAAIFDITGFASYNTTITEEWDDATNAVPITDVATAAQTIWDRCGIWPNALIINRKVFRNLRVSDQIVARIASSGAGFPTRARDVTVAQLQEVFDLDYVLVAGSPKNTADQGQSVSISPIWSDEYAMLCKIATSADPREPCIGRTFHWGEDGSDIGGMVESYRDEAIRSDVVRVRHQVDEVVLYAECGQLFDNVTS